MLFSRSPFIAFAVSAMIGSPANCGIRRIAAVVAYPSISGIMMSISTTVDVVVLLQHLDALAAVLGVEHLQPVLLQHAGEREDVPDVVVDDEHLLAVEVTARPGAYQVLAAVRHASPSCSAGRRRRRPARHVRAPGDGSSRCPCRRTRSRRRALRARPRPRCASTSGPAVSSASTAAPRRLQRAAPRPSRPSAGVSAASGSASGAIARVPDASCA